MCLFTRPLVFGLIAGAYLMSPSVVPCHAQRVLFEDAFRGELANQWKRSGIEETDVRIGDGYVELRLKPSAGQRVVPC